MSNKPLEELARRVEEVRQQQFLDSWFQAMIVFALKNGALQLEGIQKTMRTTLEKVALGLLKLLQPKRQKINQEMTRSFVAA